MTIQFNADKNIASNGRTATYLNSIVLDSLDRFSDNITRVAIHLSDENGNKNGARDKRCVLEARLEGLKPIAVTNYADTVEKSVNGAMEKLIGTLDRTLERQRAY